MASSGAKAGRRPQTRTSQSTTADIGPDQEDVHENDSEGRHRAILVAAAILLTPAGFIYVRSSAGLGTLGL